MTETVGISDNELKTLAAGISLNSKLGTVDQVMAIARTRAKANKITLEAQLQGMAAAYETPEKKVENPAATPAAPAAAASTTGDEEAIVTALAEVNDSQQIIDISQGKAMRQALDEMKRSVLRESDIVKIGGKPCIKRSGCDMYAAAFRVSTTIIDEHHDVEQLGNLQVVGWHFTVRASLPNGRHVDNVGSCYNNERPNMRIADVRATAETRARNRAILDLVGAGEVSADEIGE